MFRADTDLVAHLAGLDVHLGDDAVHFEDHPQGIVPGPDHAVAGVVRQRDDPFDRPVRDADLGERLFLKRAQPDRARLHEIVIQAMGAAGRGKRPPEQRSSGLGVDLEDLARSGRSVRGLREAPPFARSVRGQPEPAFSKRHAAGIGRFRGQLAKYPGYTVLVGSFQGEERHAVGQLIHDPQAFFGDLQAIGRCVRRAHVPGDDGVHDRFLGGRFPPLRSMAPHAAGVRGRSPWFPGHFRSLRRVQPLPGL